MIVMTPYKNGKQYTCLDRPSVAAWSSLHPFVEFCDVRRRDFLASCVLREEREDCGAGVAANDGDLARLAGDLLHELIRTDAVERRNTHDFLCVEALLLPEL